MNARVRTAVIGGVLLVAAVLVGASLAQRGMGGAPGAGYGNGYGMMGQGPGGYAAQTLDWNAARAMIQAGAQGATVDTAANTVTYSGSRVTMNVIAVQPDRPDTTFEIAGLVDPTVMIPRGATVTLNLVNMDYGADMPHGVVITRFPPPYPYMAMPMMGGGIGYGIPPLTARSDENLQTASYAVGAMQFRASTPGTYYYVCQVPGHAQDGMYGKLVVE